VRKSMITTVALTGLVAALNTGCAMHWVKPDSKVVNLPPKQASPIPLRVGITVVKQDFSHAYGDIAVEFKNCLDEVGLFEAVYHPPGSSSEMDATIALTATMGYRHGGHHAHSLYDHFVTNPFTVFYGDTLMTGKAVISRGEEIVKTYNASAKAFVQYQQSGAEKTKQEMVAALLARVCARLAEKMVADREFLEAELRVTQPAPPAKEAEPF
jgi:hypothetical protein